MWKMSCYNYLILNISIGGVSACHGIAITLYYLIIDEVNDGM